MFSRKFKPGKKALALTGSLATCAATVYGTRKLLQTLSRPLFDLNGAVVLITGGSRGLGYALAEELGTRGARLALCARDPDELQRACDRLGTQGISAAPFPCDITNSSEIPTLVERVIAHFGKVDVLINNAGYIKVGPFSTFEYSDYERAMNVMFWAPVNLTFAVLPHMQTNGRGQIVNITSIGGRVSVPHLLPYSCAKFAFVGFSTGLSAELHRKGVHVLTVVPGLMRTGSYVNAEFTGAAKDEFAWFGLLGNLPGISVSAGYAARTVRRAIEARRHTCTVGLPAKLLMSSEALAPEITRTALGLVNRALLPNSTSHSTHFGNALDSSFGNLFHTATSLGKRAALRLNE
jgi:short-subunit dehydrogenase